MTEEMNLTSPIQTILKGQSAISIQIYLHSAIDTILNLFSKIKVMLKLISEFELEEL